MSKTGRSLFSFGLKAGLSIVGADGLDDIVHAVLGHGEIADIHDGVDAAGHFHDVAHAVTDVHVPDLGAIDHVTSVADMHDLSMLDAVHHAGSEVTGNIPLDGMGHPFIPPVDGTEISLLPHMGDVTVTHDTLESLGYHHVEATQPGEHADVASGSFGGVYGGRPTDGYGNGPMNGQGNNPWNTVWGKPPTDIQGNPWTGPNG